MTTISLTPPKAISKDKVLLSNDRVFKLTPLGKTKEAKSSLIDTRLFTGENKLHLRCGPGNNLWSFRYEMGGVPPALQQRFTSHTSALNFATTYFKSRNVKIEEDINASAALAR